MNDQIVSINCARELRFEGSKIEGSVNLNTVLAKEKNITAVTVSLKAWIHTWAQVSTGQSTYKVTDSEPLLKLEQSLWTSDTALPDHPYGVINLPFLFTIPDDRPLPPSLHSGGWSHGGRIQYYVHVVADKKAWYKRNARVNAPFPFLPLDRTSAPSLQFDPWSGPWTKLDKAINVRSNALKLFGSQSSVDVSIHLPQAESLPLFTRIPCRIHIICNSKPMSTSNSIDPSSFTFPRNPKMTDIELELKQHCYVKAKIHKRNFKESFGVLGGFGTLENLSNIDTQMTEPIWVPDEEKPEKGRWTESVTYATYLILRCPTTINTRLIRTEISIDAKINFPGLGNSWKATIGPLHISSGVTTPQQSGGDRASHNYDMTVPPSYWDVMGEDDVDSKEEKKEKFWE